MDELTGRLEPGIEPDVRILNRQENITRYSSDLNTELESAEQKTTQKLVGMPEVDTPAFWEWVNHPVPGNIPQPEALAWAVHQFILRDQPEKARELFTALYTIFNPEAEKLALKNKYVNLSPQNRLRMAQDTVNRTWLAIYEKHLKNKDRPFSLYNFKAYFSSVVNTKARDLAIELGYIVRVSPGTSENSPGNPDSSGTKSKIIKNTTQQSLDAALGAEGNSGEEEGTNLLSVLADPQATADFDEIEKAEIYQNFIKRLTSEEIEILKLRLEDYNISEIARFLKRDWQTIDRRIKSIQQITIEVFGGVRRANGSKRRKVGRVPGN